MSPRSHYTIHVLTPVANRVAPCYEHSLSLLSNTFDQVHLYQIHSCSEVARARNLVATKAALSLMRQLEVTDLDLVHAALKRQRELGYHHLVLWLDSDMLIDPQSLDRHLQAVLATRLPISGRYPQRQRQRIAASLDEHRLGFDRAGFEFSPVHAGMGALMLPADTFARQLLASPYCAATEDPHWLACCPRIEEHPDAGHIMLSEDFDYCRSLEQWGGVWFAKRKSDGAWIDYGHLAERVEMLPSDYDHALQR